MNTNPTLDNGLRIPSIVDPSTNKIIKRGRVSSPADLVSAWDSLWWADLTSAQFRAIAQSWRDGAPPYSGRKEALMGTAGRTNVNWGIGDQIASDAEMPYNDLLEGVDTLFTMPTNYGSVSERVYLEQVMAEEVTRMLRNWPRFDPLYQQNVRLFVDEGVSFCFFEDDYGWQWDVIGLQHIVFPRRVKADVEELDIVLAQRQLLPHKLFERCADEAAAANEGWNREATWEAIKTAGQHTLKANDFQEWETAWKNHDYILGQTAITVEVIEGWVREVDGTVSHYICRSDGDGDFLYKKEGKYKSMSRMLKPFLYGIGANGTFHSIHGVLQKTFGAGMAQNKLFCRAIDMGIHSSTPFLKCESEEALSELPLTPLGQYVGMSPGYSWAEAQTPDFEKSLDPLLAGIQGFLNVRAAPYTQASSAIDKTPRTAYEKKSEDERSAKLSSSGMTLFKNGLTGLYREVVRRIIQDPYPQSWVGGPEVQEFIARCMDRGVPLEAIRRVDVKRVEVNMGIGRGSAAARRVAVDSLNSLYPRADAEGQNLINYLTASTYTDASLGRAIFPFKPGLRPPQDAEDANNENSAIMSMAALQAPQTIMVLPTQNHAIHLESHIYALGAVNQALEQQQMPVEKAINLMQPLLAHAIEHLQLLDPSSPQRGVYTSELKQIREVVTNGARQIAAQQAKMQREMEHNGPQSMQPENENATYAGAPPEGMQQTPGASLLIQSAEAQQKLQNAASDKALAIAKFHGEEQRKNALTAAEIQAKLAKV